MRETRIARFLFRRDTEYGYHRRHDESDFFVTPRLAIAATMSHHCARSSLRRWRRNVIWQMASWQAGEGRRMDDAFRSFPLAPIVARSRRCDLRLVSDRSRSLNRDFSKDNDAFFRPSQELGTWTSLRHGWVTTRAIDKIGRDRSRSKLKNICGRH